MIFAPHSLPGRLPSARENAFRVSAAGARCIGNGAEHALPRGCLPAPPRILCPAGFHPPAQEAFSRLGGGRAAKGRLFMKRLYETLSFNFFSQRAGIFETRAVFALQCVL